MGENEKKSFIIIICSLNPIKCKISPTENIKDLYGRSSMEDLFLMTAVAAALLSVTEPSV